VDTGSAEGGGEALLEEPSYLALPGLPADSLTFRGRDQAGPVYAGGPDDDDGSQGAIALPTASKEVGRAFGVEEDDVTPGAKFIEDLGADSLDTVELVMALEEHFDIQIPDEDAEKIVTVGDAIAYIKENS